MNTFRFVGKLVKAKNGSITERGNCKILKFGIRQNENNIGFVQLTALPIRDKLYVCGNKGEGRFTIDSEKRFDEEVLKNISYASKYTTNIGAFGGKDLEFLTPMDLLEHLQMNLSTVSKEDIVVVTGNYVLSEYKGKYYNNFEIKSVRVDNTALPQLTLRLDLFYNNKSLDMSDAKNRMILNAYIEQYSRQDKKKEYYPLTTQFNTSNYDFKNAIQVEKLKYRKANLNPKPEEGFVKSTWECQYVRGAQLITPPLESLPKEIRFEIENAGRELKEYMTKVVGEAKEIICLIRPDNLNTDKNQVYEPLNIADEDFLSNVNIIETPQTINNVAKENAMENPFN